MSYYGEKPTELTQLEQDVTRWRSVRKLPCPMPRNFWERAAALAQQVGVGEVAQALRLNPTVLKRRMAEAKTSGDTGLVSFVELFPPTLLQPRTVTSLVIGECALEVDSIEGSRLRVTVKELSTEALASVLRNFTKEAR